MPTRHRRTNFGAIIPARKGGMAKGTIVYKQ